jgi:6-phospho-3-hexuloisomerase
MDSIYEKSEKTAIAIHNNLNQILQENITLAENIDYSNFSELIDSIQQADAIFLIASGRSGFSMRSVAMRLMHLGLKVFFVGDTTTPAIKAGDLLWAASGSGTTGTIVKAAEKAKQVGAGVIAVSTNASSALAIIADIHILIPAAEKQDHDSARSKQYAGSLFEQALLLLGDAVFIELWKIDGTPAEELWKRHANME